MRPMMFEPLGLSMSTGFDKLSLNGVEPSNS